MALYHERINWLYDITSLHKEDISRHKVIFNVA